MALVAGVDSSTQSVKIVVRDAKTGELVREARGAHPDATEVDPRIWWTELQQATSGLLDGVAAVSVGGQQHGMVALDAQGEPVRDALLWNDTRSAQTAADLVAELGGAQAWVDAVGSVPLAAFTVSKVRWLAQHEPERAARVERILLPHDYLTWQLAGRPDVASTDRGDASGTGYWSPAAEQYRMDIFEMAFGRSVALPKVAAPHEHVGTIAGTSIILGPGTGDNMAAALALDLAPGDIAVSLGTSGTAFARSTIPAADPSGFVAGFADATGEFLPLVCTLNAARVLTAAAGLLGMDMETFAQAALAAPPGAEGLTVLPYLDGERTPNLPDAAGTLAGIRRSNLTPQNLARAAVEGMMCGLADAVDALIAVGVTPRRVMLIGGAAANRAVAEVAATLFDVPVVVPAPGEYVADGAARQAAWVLSGESEPPRWSGALNEAPEFTGERVPHVRDQYRSARLAMHPDSERRV